MAVAGFAGSALVLAVGWLTGLVVCLSRDRPRFGVGGCDRAGSVPRWLSWPVEGMMAVAGFAGVAGSVLVLVVGWLAGLVGCLARDRPNPVRHGGCSRAAYGGLDVANPAPVVEIGESCCGNALVAMRQKYQQIIS